MENLNSYLKKYFYLKDAFPEHFKNTGRGIEVIADKEKLTSLIERLKIQFHEKGFPKCWAEIGVFYEDPYLWFVRDLIRFSDGTLNTHHRIIRKDKGLTGVAFLGVYKGKIVMLNHFRHPARKSFLEIPRGGIIEGKTPEETIIEEVYEEIYGKIKSLIKLEKINPSTSIDTSSVLCFYGEYESIGNPSLSEGIIEVLSFTVKEVETMIKNGVITDAITICSFLHAKLRDLL